MKIACNFMPDEPGVNLTVKHSLTAMTLLFMFSASAAFALAVPTSGLGFAVYTIINGIYSTGIGYVIAGCMFLWGCVHLPKDWKESLLWMAGGMGVGSLVTLIGATGLNL